MSQKRLMKVEFWFLVVSLAPLVQMFQARPLFEADSLCSRLACRESLPVTAQCSLPRTSQSLSVSRHKWELEVLYVPHFSASALPFQAPASLAGQSSGHQPPLWTPEQFPHNLLLPFYSTFCFFQVSLSLCVFCLDLHRTSGFSISSYPFLGSVPSFLSVSNSDS